jgi:hypothetical protein
VSGALPPCLPANCAAPTSSVPSKRAHPPLSIVRMDTMEMDLDVDMGVELVPDEPIAGHSQDTPVCLL